MQAYFNLERYRDKVLGCWTGKNIGGTLGGPLEGKRETNEIEFYPDDFGGEALPNDDLDLQLIWLAAAELKGLYQLTPRILGEFWMSHIPCPSGEYSVCRANIANGFYPPLSGAWNNEHLKFSNGAWIRSEIWACVFPGSPDEAAKFAWMDACADHVGDGIYAEMFTAALESAAFVESDLRRLIDIGLAKIPRNCRIARAVRLVCEGYDRGDDWKILREAVVKDSEDIGWFQAPANVAFTVLGLLYGEGDFGKSICRAVNCGDDADCTGATAGAIMGIILGRSNIPEKWSRPVGETIKTIAISPPNAAAAPKDLQELTRRTMRLAQGASLANRRLPRFGDGDDCFPPEKRAELTSAAVAEKIWTRSSNEMEYELGYAKLAVEYENGPLMTSGERKRLRLKLRMYDGDVNQIYYAWRTPGSWRITPQFGTVLIKDWWESVAEYELEAGEFSGVCEYLALEVRLPGRNIPQVLTIPVELSGGAVYPNIHVDYPLFAETRLRITGWQGE